MTAAALTTLAALVSEVGPDETPGEAFDPRAPAWALGLIAFAILCTLLFVVTRFNRDR